MTSSTTAARRARFPRWLWGLSLGLHIGGFVLLQHFGILNYAMSLDRQDADAQVRQARERHRDLEKQQKEERAQRELTEEDARQLREHAEEQYARELREHVRHLVEIDQRIAEMKETEMQTVETRPESNYRRRLAEQIYEASFELCGITTSLFYRYCVQLPASETVLRTSRELMRHAFALKRDPGSPAHARNVREQADEEVAQTQALMRSTPGDRDARAASQLSQEVQRLAHLLTADPVDLSEFNDTSPAQHPADPALDPQRLAELAQQTPAELYDLARALEGRIHQNYTDVRGGQLAMADNTSLAEALRNLAEMSPKTRPDFPELSGQNFPTLGDLNAFREALQGAALEGADMRSQAMNLLAQMCGLPSIMEGMGGGMGNNPFAMGLPGTFNGVPLHLNLDLTPLRDMGLEGGAPGKTWDDRFMPGGAGMDAFAQLPEMTINRYTVQAQALPGRKFTRDSERTGWLYINTWYVIGPWENYGRIDWGSPHPPEHNLDLDAVYSDGKKGEYFDHLLGGEIQLDGKLHWQFLQSDTIRITFPNEVSDGTYYAYTEIFFEEDEDMLLAIASDDAARVWVNGLALHEEHELSSWELGERYKKIPFQKGINTMLVRLENGPTYAQLSVLLCPPDVLAP